LSGCRDVQVEGLAERRQGQEQRFGDECLEVVKCLVCLVRPAERIRLLQQLVQGKPAVYQPRYKMAEGSKASHKLLDVLDIPGLAYFDDARDLVGVHFDTMIGDDVSL
jgi:hypothetical protein